LTGVTTAQGCEAAARPVARAHARCRRAERSAGCRFELEQLVHSVPLERWAVIVDARADMAFLRSCLDDAWRTMAHGAPNAAKPMEAVRVHPLDASSDGIDRPFAHLYRADLVTA
jgi:hypothetical protein